MHKKQKALREQNIRKTRSLPVVQQAALWRAWYSLAKAVKNQTKKPCIQIVIWNTFQPAGKVIKIRWYCFYSIVANKQTR